MDLGKRIVTTGAVPAGDPALVIAATAARQAASPTARLAVRLSDRTGAAGASAETAATAGGSFHGGIAPAVASTFVKPGFTVAF